MNDPFGCAIEDFFNTQKSKNILVNSNYTEEETIPASWFFRTQKEMPVIEQVALKLCHGKVLDIGAAAGCHSVVLQQNNIRVTALEKSEIAVNILKKRGIKNVVNANIFDYSDDTFDTLLLLMNGAGLGGTVAGLGRLLVHLKSLLNPGGQILIDSSDIKYLFEEEDGSYWVDVANSQYYGEMEYEVRYKNQTTWFKWLFIDFDNLVKVAAKARLHCSLVQKGEHFDYLARLTH